jgi:GT2 family glycosyltransferase
MARADIAVLAFTKNKSAQFADFIQRLQNQTLPPDHIFVIGSEAEDLAKLDKANPQLSISLGRKGIAAQLNDAIALTEGRFKYLLFFADDFIPSRFWIERAVAVLESSKDIVGLTGRLLADGENSSSTSLDDALSLVDLYDGLPQTETNIVEPSPLRGCNMAVRRAAVGAIWFDESLPVSGWMEDADFSARVARRGRVVRSPALYGVQLPPATPRTSGFALGFAQVVNPVYLARKGRLGAVSALVSITGNFARNALGALWIGASADDRRRFYGNIRGLGGLMHMSRGGGSHEPFPGDRSADSKLHESQLQGGKGDSKNTFDPSASIIHSSDFSCR